jgi:hypothetical protein
VSDDMQMLDKRLYLTQSPVLISVQISQVTTQVVQAAYLLLLYYVISQMMTRQDQTYL